MSILSDFYARAAMPSTPSSPPTAPSEAFPRALELVLRYEGGFSSDAADPGNWTGGKCGSGACHGTLKGIASSAYADNLRLLGSAAAGFPASVADLSDPQVAAIYRVAYWNRVRGDDLAPALALVAFDSAVNCGTGRAARWLQDVCGTPVDGSLGPNSVAAARAAVSLRGASAIAGALLDEREAFYEGLPTFGRYGHGWLARIDDLRKRLDTFPHDQGIEPGTGWHRQGRTPGCPADPARACRRARRR